MIDRRWWALSTLLLAGLGVASLADAQERLIRFQIPAKSTREALLDLALQANVLLGGDVDACGGTSNPVAGRFTVEQALTQLLAGGGCGFSVQGGQAVVIHKVRQRIVGPRPPQSPAIPPPPVPRPASSDEPRVLGEIVVTAQRRAELPGRTPMSISAFSGQQLEDRGVMDLDGLANETAGMTVTNLGPGRDKILLRGLSDGVFTGAAQSTVGLYLDDVPVTYNAPNPDLRLVDIDRVEVLRGPQGTLYGVGSIGGIVRTVTAKPDLDQFVGNFEAGVAATQSGKPSVESEAVVNLPLIRGRVAVRVAAYSERRGGYIDDVNLAIKDINGVARDGVRAAIRVGVTPNWTVSAGVVHQSINSDDTQYATEGLGPLQRASAVREPHDNDFDASTLSVEGGGAWGRITATTERILHQLDDQYDASPALPEFGLPPGVASFGDTRRIELFVNELAYASPQNGRLRWLAGFFQSTGETALHAGLKLPNLGYTEDRLDTVDELAAYGEATYDLTDRVSLIAGARWFNYSYSTRSLVTQRAESRQFDGKGEASGFSPKLVVRFQATPRSMFYAQAAQGYRPGGFNTSGVIGQVFDGQRDNPARQYDPDQLWNFEVGTKLSLLRDQLQLRTAVFYAVWDSIQTDQFLKSGLPYTVNVGDGRNLGLEVEAAWRASEHWQFRLAGLINDPQIIKPSPAFAARPDAGLPGVPAGSISGGLTYRRPIRTGLDLLIDVEAEYVGASHLTFDALKIYDMGGYADGRLSAAIDSRRWRLTGFIDNPLNQTANTFAFGDPFRIGHSVEATPLRPRTIGVRLDTRF